MAAREPLEPDRTWEPLFHIEMVAMQGDTAIAIGGAGEKGPGERAFEFVGRIQSALGLASHLKRDGWLKLLVEQALMRRRVVELEKVLGGLFKLQRRSRQRKLSVDLDGLYAGMR
jgi:hypothetical protein